MGIVVPLETSVYNDFHANVIFVAHALPPPFPPEETIIPLEMYVYNEWHADVNFIAPPPSVNFDVNAIVSFVPNSIFNPNENQPLTISAISNSISNVEIGAGEVILAATISVSGAFLAGIQAAGDADGEYHMYINDTLLFRFFTNIMKPEINYNLPGALELNNGDVITLYVISTGDARNTGGIPLNYQGTLLGSF